MAVKKATAAAVKRATSGEKQAAGGAVDGGRAGRAADTRSALLDAAKGLFARHGYKKVSMSDIAMAAGVTRPTVYAYFPNKDEVLNAVIEREGREVVEAGMKNLDANAVAPAQIAQMYTAVEKQIMENTILKEIAARDMDVLTPDVITIAMRFESIITEELARILEQGMEEGTIARTDPVLMAYAMVRLHEAFTFTPFINLEGYDRGKINEFIFGLVAKMLAPLPDQGD